MQECSGLTGAHRIVFKGDMITKERLIGRVLWEPAHCHFLCFLFLPFNSGQHLAVSPLPDRISRAFARQVHQQYIVWDRLHFYLHIWREILLHNSRYPSVFDYVTLVPWPLLFQVRRDIIRHTINPCNFPLTIAICVSFLKFQVFDRGVHLFILVRVWICRTS